MNYIYSALKINMIRLWVNVFSVLKLFVMGLVSPLKYLWIIYILLLKQIRFGYGLMCFRCRFYSCWVLGAIKTLIFSVSILFVFGLVSPLKYLWIIYVSPLEYLWIIYVSPLEYFVIDTFRLMFCLLFWLWFNVFGLVK